jgi:predicted transcriptional regulator
MGAPKIGRTKAERYLAKNQMKKMCEENKSLEDIGKHFGITKQAVSLHLMSIGYFPRHEIKNKQYRNKQNTTYESLVEVIENKNLKIASLQQQIIYRNKKIKKLEEKIGKINELLCNN